LNPGVDSSQANSEVSRAKLLVIDARDNEQQVRNLLAQYLKLEPNPFQLDTTLFNRLPAEYNTDMEISQNPQVRFYKRRVEWSDQTALFLRRSVRPGFNFFSVFQTRASGFASNYTPDFPSRYTQKYWDGVNPSRSNYLMGVS